MREVSFKKRIALFLLAVTASILLALAVIVPAQAAKIRLNKTKLELEVGESFRLKLKGTKKKPKWKSAEKYVATVNKKGKVTAKNPGRTYIIAKVGKKIYKCDILVKEPMLDEEYAEDEEQIEKTKQNEHGFETPFHLTEEEVYAKLIALKETYPDGTPWGDDACQNFKGGIFDYGYGCAAFAFMLSDAAFGDLPARQVDDYHRIRVGDLLRVDHDRHVVVALKVEDDGVIVAEGNYNSSVLWGRKITNQELQEGFSYLLTRYPD